MLATCTHWRLSVRFKRAFGSKTHTDTAVVLLGEGIRYVRVIERAKRMPAEFSSCTKMYGGAPKMPHRTLHRLHAIVAHCGASTRRPPAATAAASGLLEHGLVLEPALPLHPPTFPPDEQKARNHPGPAWGSPAPCMFTIATPMLWPTAHTRGRVHDAPREGGARYRRRRPSSGGTASR